MDIDSISAIHFSLAKNSEGFANKSSYLGYNASLMEISAFNESLNKAAQNQQVNFKPQHIERAAEALAKPLDDINLEVDGIVDYAKKALSSNTELTPSEIVMLTAKSQEFMFHCQLTSNIANKTSDGIQQLFRQQS